MASLTFLTLAEKTLREIKKPLTAEQIWIEADSRGHVEQLGSEGRTPIATLHSALLVNSRLNESKFIALGSRPKLWYLKDQPEVRQSDIDQLIPVAETVIFSKDRIPLEKELHKHLAYFAWTNFETHVKTITTCDRTRKAIPTGFILIL